MDLLPAIDIRNGRVVRLSQGERTRQTVYGDDPVAVAEHFVSQGAGWIHVVDLDRAFGTGDNLPAVRRVAKRLAATVRLQLGGGLRTLERIHEAVDLGFTRVVIGTAAAAEPAFVSTVLSAIRSDQVAVGIDARNGFVAVRGWTETSTTTAEELTRQVVAAGIRTVIHTDIGRDGMLSGPDIAAALALQASGARVIASGGVGGSADVRAVCQAGLHGVIVGRAFYEGRLTVSEALQAAACSSSS